MYIILKFVKDKLFMSEYMGCKLKGWKKFILKLNPSRK